MMCRSAKEEPGLPKGHGDSVRPTVMPGHGLRRFQWGQHIGEALVLAW